MKRGYMFFLNMGNITRVARITLIPAIIFLFFAKGFLMIGVAALLLLICIGFSLIPVPSDDVAMSAIKSFHKSFEERIYAKTRKKENIQYLKGYQIKGKMFLKRQVKNKVVYPIPMVVSIISMNKDKEDYLMIGRMSLLKNNPPKFEDVEMLGSNICIESFVEDEDESTMIIHIKINETQEDIKFVVENNYMSREFVGNVLSKLKI